MAVQKSSRVKTNYYQISDYRAIVPQANRKQGELQRPEPKERFAGWAMKVIEEIRQNGHFPSDIELDVSNEDD